MNDREKLIAGYRWQMQRLIIKEVNHLKRWVEHPAKDIHEAVRNCAQTVNRAVQVRRLQMKIYLILSAPIPKFKKGAPGLATVGDSAPELVNALGQRVPVIHTRSITSLPGKSIC